MSLSKCCICFQTPNEFPEYFKTVLTAFVQLFNKFQNFGLQRIQVDKLAVCKPCWACVIQVHQFDHELRLKKTTCDSKKAFLASKIRRAQRSSVEGGNLPSCKDSEGRISASQNNEDSNSNFSGQTVGDTADDIRCSLNKTDESDDESLDSCETAEVVTTVNVPISGTQEKDPPDEADQPQANVTVPVEDQQRYSPQAPCRISLKGTGESDVESTQLYEVNDVRTPDKVSLAANSGKEEPVEPTSDDTSESSSSDYEPDESKEDPKEVMSVDTSDSDSEPESEPDKNRRVTSRSKRHQKNLKRSSRLRISRSNVKKLSETDFMYLKKYPFQKTDVDFKCGLCSGTSIIYNGSPTIELNMLKHIHRWHISNHRVRSNKIKQRFIEIAPNRFQYGNFKAEWIDGKYRCEECGEFSAESTGQNKAANIMEHIRRHHENPPRSFVCEHCGNVYRTSFALSEHKKTKHENKDGPFPCSECGKTFPTRFRTSTHQKLVHGTKQKFICELCGKECSQKNNLASHIAFVHNGQKFECNDCDKIFGSKFALNIHRHCHLGTKFVCDICGMDFSQQSSIRRHKKKAHL